MSPPEPVTMATGTTNTSLATALDRSRKSGVRLPRHPRNASLYGSRNHNSAPIYWHIN